MVLSEEEKKKIEEEEDYRAQVREKSKKYKGRGCLKWLLIIFFILLVIAAILPAANNTDHTPKSPAPDSQSIQKTKEKELEIRKVQTQALANLYCFERSKPNVRAVNLADFIAMYEANGETVTLRPANGVYPTEENCRKIIDICLDLWSSEDCKNISETKIWIGMTKDQLMLSWGLPNDRNNSTYSFGVHSQWVYGSFGPYVYLEGDDSTSLKVTSWQD